MRRLTMSALLLIPACLALEYSSASAQHSVIAAGSVDAANASLHIAGTLGQSVIGPTIAYNRATRQGFWYMPELKSALAISSPVTGDVLATLQCSPNPLSTLATVRVSIPQTAHVSLTLHDLLGRTVKTLVNETKTSGAFSADINTEGISEGRYTLNLSIGAVHHTLPILIVR